MSNKTGLEGQVLYMDRYVDRESFRTFVYQVGKEQLAKSYKEFKEMIASKVWHESKEDAQKAHEEAEALLARQAVELLEKRTQENKPAVIQPEGKPNNGGTNR